MSVRSDTVKTNQGWANWTPASARWELRWVRREPQTSAMNPPNVSLRPTVITDYFRRQIRHCRNFLQIHYYRNRQSRNCHQFHSDAMDRDENDGENCCDEN